MSNTKWKWFSSTAEDSYNGRREYPSVYKVIENIVPDKKRKGQYKKEQVFLNKHIPSNMEKLKTQLKLNNMNPIKSKKKVEETNE